MSTAPRRAARVATPPDRAGGGSAGPQDFPIPRRRPDGPRTGPTRLNFPPLQFPHNRASVRSPHKVAPAPGPDRVKFWHWVRSQVLWRPGSYPIMVRWFRRYSMRQWRCGEYWQWNTGSGAGTGPPPKRRCLEASGAGGRYVTRRDQVGPQPRHLAAGLPRGLRDFQWVGRPVGPPVGGSAVRGRRRDT
jgi:hypothetical protein